MKSVCIVGGGVGGLMTGALLTKEGYRVTVLEKNRTLGGGLQCFIRKGHTFDPSMHVFGGMQPGGNLRKILDYLGVTDKLLFEPCYDTIVHNDIKTQLPFGRDAWIEAIGCGKYHKELNDYVDDLYRIADTENLFCMRPSNSQHSEGAAITAKDLIERHVSDPCLRQRLAYVAHLYDGTDDTPALLHALTSVLHIDGIYKLIPSAYTLAKSLADIIVAGGGEIHTGCEVTSIEADGTAATAVISDSKRFAADIFIGALPIGTMLHIAPRQAFSTAFRHRMAEARQSRSAFCIYGILKSNSLPYENKCYHLLIQDQWGIVNGQWPKSLFMMTGRDNSDDKFASTFTIMMPMDYSCVSRWGETTHAHRPAEYLLWKQQVTAQALHLAEEAIGPLECEYTETASPLTLRDYSGSTHGSCYGLHASVLNPALTTLSPRTRLSNLYLTGQDINFHGMIGTSLTAILTAEAIVGQDCIVNKINGQQQTIHTIWKPSR